MKQKIITLGSSFAVIVILSLIVLFVKDSGNFAMYNDRLFMVSLVISTIGFVIAITAKSRIHYYKFVRKQFAGKEVSSDDYDTQESDRNRHASFGLTVASSGILGIILCAIFAYL